MSKLFKICLHDYCACSCMYVHSGPVLGMVKVSSWRYIESLILESFIKLNKTLLRKGRI